MTTREMTKKRWAIFLLIFLYAVGFSGFLAFQSLSTKHSGLLWSDYLLAAALPAMILAYPVYHVFFMKNARG